MITGWWWLGLMSGCALFDGVKDTVEGVTNRNVAVGVVTTLEASAGELDLSKTDFAPGVGATVFFADAAKVADLDNAPITGASVVIKGCGDEAEVPESSQRGAYVYLPGGALGGCMGPAFELRRVDVEEGAVLPVLIPAPGRVEVPLSWEPGEALTLDLSTSGYGAALVVLVDTSDGSVVFSNEPETVGEYYRFLTTSDEVGAVEIPGEAFEADTVYALGVTGLERTRNRELDNVNEVLSVIAGGRTQLYPVSTYALDTDR